MQRNCPSLMDDMRQFASLPFFPPEMCTFALIFKGSSTVSGLAFVIIHCENIMKRESITPLPDLKKKVSCVNVFLYPCLRARDQAPFDFFLLYDNHVLLTINKKICVWCFFLCPVLNRTLQCLQLFLCSCFPSDLMFSTALIAPRSDSL